MMRRASDDRRIQREVHARWITRTHRDLNLRPKPDDWVEKQCYFCFHYTPLITSFGEDYGVCCAADSPMDGRAVFEHDSCDVFEWAPEDE